jgi:hypothetical protein
VARQGHEGGVGCACFRKLCDCLVPKVVESQPSNRLCGLPPTVELSALVDVALSKLERNHERDRDDVQQLARAGHLKREILRDRYYKELRPNLPAHEGALLPAEQEVRPAECLRCTP